MRFIAIASVSCISGERAPRDIADTMKRLRISCALSTSSTCTACRGPKTIRSRGTEAPRESALPRNSAHASSDPFTAFWREATTGGDHACSSASLR
jgi:hypothetical protein